MRGLRSLLLLAVAIALLVAMLASGAMAQNFIGPLPTQFSVINCGGTITTGGTAQVLFQGAAFKHGFIIEIGANDSNTDALYFSDAGVTTTPGAGVAGSFSIAASTSTAPGGSFSSPANWPVGVTYYINGATTGDAFKCRVW